MHIILSAGHDNDRYGADNVKYHLREHCCALQICDVVMSLFTGNKEIAFLDVDIHLTQFTDYQDSLKWKIHSINAIHELKPVSLVIELHFNAFAGGADGCETLYNTDTEKEYAEILQRHIQQALGNRDRGIKHRDNLGFIMDTKCPGIILEPLFIDNDKDARPLLTYKGRLALAEAIVEGIREIIRKDYKAHIEATGAKVLTC